MQVPSRFLVPFQALAWWRRPAPEAELASLRAELARVRHTAAEAIRAKNACITRTAHELRTPLNAVIGYAQLLQQEDGLSTRQATRLATIEGAGQHLAALVDDIMVLSCLEAGTFSLRPVPMRLQPFLDGVAEIVRLQAAEKGLALAVDAPGLPEGIVADDRRLRQVLLNLLANALRFTDRGEVSLRVGRVTAAGGSVGLRFEVADTGIGIAAEDLPSLFQPFQQLGDASRRDGGTGLGLTICRQLVRAMGGEIAVHSTPGQGSSFAFTLEVPLEGPLAS